MKTLSPSQRSQRARVAAFSLHARGGTTTDAARDAFMRRFEDQVDPERTLPEDERSRRARAALRAHMARLALASSRSRGSAR